MAASKCNYVVLYKTISQVYSTTNLLTALKTPIPKGATKEDRDILFVTYLPDEESLCVYPLTEDQIEQGLQKLILEEEKALERAANRAAQLEDETEEGEPDLDDY